MQIAATSPLPPVPAGGAVRARPDDGAPTAPQSGQTSDATPSDRQSEASAAERGPLELSEAEQALVRQLQQRDREVRAHEMAHVAAGGRYVTKPASYQYQVGPDGRRYAVGGEVSIDTSVPSDPQEALAKAQIIERAALAPVNPSQQDYQVAAKARQMAADARRELAAERLEQARAEDEPIQSERDADAGSDVRAGPAAGPTPLPLATTESLAPTSRISLFA
ncbi:MAG: putative metalloprotease CJM1_0395 family protein [Wenzhouxiangella sp.]